ncbi:MAG: hypothetical protein GY794_23840, partial [bacterium]|nr:hypothetical protein [bacterium]
MMVNMNTEGNQRAIETSEAVVIIAYLIGTIGVLFFGIFGLGAAANRSFSGEWVWAMIALAIMGGALGSGFVGMCALFCGARLGRYFSYPFAIYFGGLLCPVVLGSLAAIGVNVPPGLMYPGWISGVVLGVLCGWMLSGVLSVYG